MKLKTLSITALALIASQLHCDGSATTPIGQAIFDNNLDLVQKLITNGEASVDDSAYEDGYEPLLNAAIFNYNDQKNKLEALVVDEAEVKKALAIINFLLDSKADINKKSDMLFGNDAPLHIATDLNRPEIVTLLLDRVADINITGGTITNSESENPKLEEFVSRQETPLFLATALALTDIVKILLDRGANIALPDFEGRTPYDITIIHEAPEDDYIFDDFDDEITPQDRIEIKKLFDEHNKKLAEQARLQKFKEKKSDVRVFFE